jgi:hypothetical protein
MRNWRGRGREDEVVSRVRLKEEKALREQRESEVERMREQHEGAYRAISCCRTRASGVVLEVGKWEGCGRGVFRRAVRGGGGSSRRGAGEGRLQEAGRGASRIAFLRTSA